MAVGFIDVIPPQDMAKLKPGDLVFTQRLNSNLSWAMMYFTSSSIDHAAVYMGDEQVVHMTLAGTKQHSLRSVAQGCRVLIMRMNMQQLARFAYENQKETDRIDKGSTRRNELPPKLQLTVGALYTIHGKYWHRFRFKLWIEFFATTILFGTFAWFIFGYLTAFIFPLASFFALIIFIMRNLI